MRRAVLAGCAIAVALGAVVLWPTDARAIRQRLAAAAETVSAAPGESDLQQIARAASLTKHLTTDVIVDAGPDGPTVRGRDTLVAMASRLGSPGAVAVSIAVAELTIDQAAASATAGVLLRVEGGGPEVGSFDGTELRIELARADGTWLIARVTAVSALRR
jgi:hypothetical protein